MTENQSVKRESPLRCEAASQAAPVARPQTKDEMILAQHAREKKATVERMGQIIRRMITERPGGLTDKNQAEVFHYLGKKHSLTQSALAELLRVGLGQLLVEVCTMPTEAARLAGKLHVKLQKVLVFEGVEVVENLDKPPVRKRLCELSDNEAKRVIDIEMGRIRDTEMQRQLIQRLMQQCRRKEGKEV